MEAGVVRVGEWARYGWLVHGFSMRTGGVSQVYGDKELNLGWTKEDEPAAVRENRRRLERLSWTRHGELFNKSGVEMVTIRQIHSGEVKLVRERDGALEGRLRTGEGKAVLEGDGLVTDLPGVLLGIQTADCVPVLVVDVEKRVVAALHAGWRGTVAGIAEVGVRRMQEEYGSRAEDLVAAVGPSIGPCCYEVGEEVREAFEERFAYGEELIDARSRLNLWEANRRQLEGVGIRGVSVVGECTACARDERGQRRYFSHRDEKGRTGRMMGVVGVIRGI